jgi:hypothetical protein
MITATFSCLVLLMVLATAGLQDLPGLDPAGVVHGPAEFAAGQAGLRHRWHPLAPHGPVGAPEGPAHVPVPPPVVNPCPLHIRLSYTYHQVVFFPPVLLGFFCVFYFYNIP